MTMPAEVGFDVYLPPDETVEFFRAKGSYPISRRWWDVWQEEHSRAFTVAGVTNVDALKSIRASLDKMLSEGGTFEQWKAQVIPQLQRSVSDGVAPDNILSDRRLRTIYDTNLRMARAAGQWKRIDALKAYQPYLMYSAVRDNRTRPLHRKWGGIDPGTTRVILPVDHPAWRQFYPPNGWGCRCDVIQLSERAMKRQGLQLTTDAELIALGWPTSDGANAALGRDVVRGDGIIDDVPNGVDPGFAYNVGQTHLAGTSEHLRKAIDQTANTNLPMARALLREIVDSTAFDAFLVNDQQSFPVMILGPAERALLTSKTSVAVLSSDTYSKQLRNHSELTIDDYRKLLDVGENPDLIFKQDDTHIIMTRSDDNKWLKVTVKSTADREELFVVSYQFARASEIKRLRRVMELVFDAS
jgi:SPP1 gp7 family putative phage head morphogenesis protein